MERYTGCDEPAHPREMLSLMKLSETSLRQFLEEEPDLYSPGDAKVVLLK
ncbi:MAG: hypothetical protein WC362_02655 [Methanoregula sp.]|jgi:hypothetical protein